MHQLQAIQQLFEARRIAMDALCGDARLHGQLALAVQMIVKCIGSGGKILVAGNGGSASQAQHLCAELMGQMKRKRKPFQAIALPADVALLTCIANDFGYERIFSRQIEGIGHSGDIFIAFTTSGKSRNILEALLECKSREIETIVFTGRETDAVTRLANVSIEIPLEDTAVIQEMHLLLIHMACEIVENTINEQDYDPWEQVLKMHEQGFTTLLLDRDGVVNHIKTNGYVQFPSELILREDFARHAKSLAETFDHIFVVTNQKGVGKGIMSDADLKLVHEKLINEIQIIGGRIDKIYVGTSADNESPENKPNTGMARRITKDYPDVDFVKAVVVGDSISDYLFADNLNSGFIYIRTR